MTLAALFSERKRDDDDDVGKKDDNASCCKLAATELLRNGIYKFKMKLAAGSKGYKLDCQPRTGEKRKRSESTTWIL